MQSTKRPKPPSGINIQRIVLVCAAGFFLLLGFLLPWIPAIDPAGERFGSGIFLKVGLVLAIAWLAAPQLERVGWARLRGSALVGILVVLVLFTYKPRIGALAAGVFVVLSLLFSIGGWVRRFSKPPR